MLRSLRSWFKGLDRLRHAEVELDPDEPVEVALVANMNGPLAVAALEREGIRATDVAGYNLLSQTSSHTRILVRAADEEHARRVLDESGLTEASPRRRGRN